MTSDQNGGRPLPWHDTPRCAQMERDGSDCNGSMVPVESMANGYGGETGARIACSACGHGIVGSIAEVRRARRADAAWEMCQAGLVHDDRGCNGALPIERFRLCADCVTKDNDERQGVLL